MVFRRSGRQQQPPQQEDPVGFQVPASSHFRSSQEELSFLRDSLKDIYEAVLLEDLVAAVEKSVDERLWRHVFYTPIEELRGELRKLDHKSTVRQEAVDELGKLLDKGTGFYHDLITTLRYEHEVDLNSVALDVLHAEATTGKGKPPAAPEIKSSQGRTKAGRSRQQSRTNDESSVPSYSMELLANCIQKCYLYLGDLARYRTNIRLETQTIMSAAQLSGAEKPAPQLKPLATEWQAAHQFYLRAIHTFPDSGKPYGQLAILAAYAHDDLDSLYWYTLSLGAKSPSIIVRDNLKVYFSRYQNRHKDLLSAICPPIEDSDHNMSTDDDTDIPPKIRPAQQLALARCDLISLFIKIQMDLFAPHLDSATMHDPTFLDAFNQKASAELESGKPGGVVQKMIVSIILVVHDLHARTSLSSFAAESSTKEGAMGLKQAQRVGLIYLLGVTTALLNRQLAILGSHSKPQTHLDQELLAPLHLVLEFWLSHWDQIWGMIRLEEKWTSVNYSGGRSELSLRKATVAFFRSFVNLINIVRPKSQDHPNLDDIAQKALSLLQQDGDRYLGLLPFRRFRTLLTVCFDVVEDPVETKRYRLLLFADKVVQASEGIRGTVLELSIEPPVEEDKSGAPVYRVMDADDKRTLRERGSKMLASHWLQNQVSSLQKGLEDTERRNAHAEYQEHVHGRKEGSRARALIPISSLPGTVKLPLSGQTRLTDHYQRGTPKFVVPGAPHHGRSAVERGAGTAGPSHAAQQSRGRHDKNSPPYWTCVIDFSVLVWNLADIKVLMEHRQCLLIVPLDVIDRLDQAKKGQDKENQKAREAIRFLDERLNMKRWGGVQPLLVGQNIKDSLGRWSEAVPFLVEEEEEPSAAATAREMMVEQDGDTVMSETQSLSDPESTQGSDRKRSRKAEGIRGEAAELSEDDIQDDDEVEVEPMEEEDEEEEVEIRNVMNVPRVWRPILGACLFMLRKRDTAHRIPEERFVLLTEDQDLAYFARWFRVPTSTVHAWKHNGL
ncbi:hypothetical protein BGZ98_005241 [Dissophora globulifera]|nr:hypothetical protein BGZ98_005241 [Dissophora globulifera]